MTTLKFADTHNMIAFLSKPIESDEFEQIVDFLNAHPIRYALTINPTIHISCLEQFWSTIVVKTINGEVQLHALVDGKKIIITKESVRRDLQLADEEGVDCLPNSTIFKQLTLMGKPKRKDTQEPQSSDPIENVTDEVIHKELGDSLVRAATTSSSLEGEKDSGGGPRCQETIGDTIAHTRFESVSKHSNDSLLARVAANEKDDELNVVEEVAEVINTATLITDTTTLSAATITTDYDGDITFAQALIEMKSTKPKVKGVVIQELGESTTTISSQQSQDKGKGILIEPVKKKDQILLDEE
ncbi:hypothetical protein Tco_1396228, partial [Tanacetum coccineum]